MIPGDPILRLLPYQRRWFEDRSRFAAGMFARQTGKTFTTCLAIVDDCYHAEAAGRRARWVILSRGERQAREAMEEAIKPFCRAYQEIARRVVPEFTESVWRGSEVVCSALEARFPGGSRITALPANPDTARGFSANVFLDEFAFHQDSRAIWSALFPVVSREGLSLRVVSTPNGKGNRFYDLMTDEGSLWSRHRVTIHDAVADGLSRNIGELRQALGDEDAWRQEYELEWLDEASSWLSFELIGGCETPEAGRPDRYGGGWCFVGVDIAARNDLFVIWVIEAVGDVLWTREIITRQGVTFAEQAHLLDEVLLRYRVTRVAMDQTGMGEAPVEEARRRHGGARVEGVLFTAPAKMALAIRGREAFEDRKIRIPAGEALLRADLHKLRKITSATGAPRLVADTGKDGHADRTWACFLAIHAAWDGAKPAAGASVEAVDGTYRPERPGGGGFRQSLGQRVREWFR